MKANTERINILDSVRVIAVIMVMLHHYYSQSTYSATKNIEKYFHFGALGVPLFFIISGFVIYSTLERTKNYREFLIKRFIRLSPAMVICSTLVFIFFSFFYTGEGYDHSKSFPNYIIANTFIDPSVFNIPLGYVKYYYIDNAYWSLWVEVCFYSLIGFLYFFFRNKFILYYVIICCIGTPLFLLFYSSTGQNILHNYFSVGIDEAKYYKLVARSFVFFYDCTWFLLGIYLYQLYKNNQNKKYIYYILLILLFNILKERNLETFIFSVIVFLFLMIFIYKPYWIEFMENPILCKIGIASYAMYLIHYHLGVVAIKAMNNYLGVSYIYPIIIIFITIGFGLFCYNYLEKNLIKVYKKIILK